MVFERVRRKNWFCKVLVRAGSKVSVRSEFKDLGTVWCKHESMEGEHKSEEGMQGMGVLNRLMKKRSVRMGAEKGMSL